MCRCGGWSWLASREFMARAMVVVAVLVRSIPALVNSTAWPLRYAEEYREDGKRYILLAADRPIDFWEAVDRPMRTWQYRTTLIELVLDENNRGEGAMAVGAALTIDPEQGTLNVKHMTTTGVRLTNVRK